MRLRNTILGFTSFLTLFAGSLFLVQPTSAIGNIGGRPAMPRENEPRSQSIFIHTLKKGQAVDDKVLVSNQSDQTQTIVLYAVDAIPSNTGSFTCKQRAEANTDAGAWIKLAKSEITLKANDSDIVNFKVTAPKDVDIGEHNACLAFESKDDEGQVSGNLRIRTRSAIRVALTIPGKLHREISIASYEIDQKNYQQRYTIGLHNVGNVSADTNVEVRLRTLFGGTVYTNGGNYPVLANKNLELSYENDKSPFFGGWYFAEASASYDKNASTWSAQRTTELTTVYAKNQIIFIWPQPFAIVIIILLVAIIIWLIIWLLRHEKQRLEIVRSWQSHTIKKGETIQSLADSRSVSWKKLARINKLKAPYALLPGEKLYIPRKKPLSRTSPHTKEKK